MKKNMIDIGYLTEKDYQSIVMTLNEIKEMGAPFHFEQCKCFICKGKKNIYIENEKEQRIYLKYDDSLQEWYLESYIVMEGFEGGYNEFIEFFKKNYEFFTPTDLIILEETITINGDTIEELELSDLFNKMVEFYRMNKCKVCNGLTLLEQSHCNYCKGNKNAKKITLWQREVKKRKA